MNRMALIEFYGEECSHCENMAPLVQQLEKEGFKIQKLETWHHDENESKRQKIDKGMCGGVPFFFNTDSGKFICGEESYEALKAWAAGE